MYTGTGIGLLGLGAAGFMTVILAIGLWSVVWKGWALWIAARKGEKVWFIIMLVLNTVGILEILYIFIFSKRESLNTKVGQDNQTEGSFS